MESAPSLIKKEKRRRINTTKSEGFLGGAF
jgi:hypothetical protein